ncbi:MAG: AtpZ/AtpI family protein [Chloroflexi bacterium]|nr:AtpZ/AtpI family protein [Chloroflexota bacterium]
MGIGWYFATCIVLGTLGGLWLDGQVDAKPLFTLLGILLGMIVAAWGAYRMLKNVMSPPGSGRP